MEGAARAAGCRDAGSTPAIGGSRSRGARGCSGSSAAAPGCTGCCGRVEDVVDRPLLDHPAEVHHHHVVGHLGDHAQIVGDQHDGHAVFAAAAGAAARGSAPGWSRRARWSARRRSAASARTTAPWRSSRAGAGRRSAGRRSSSMRCSGAGCRPGAASRSPARAPRACSTAGASRIASMIWLPTVCTGLNEVIGSWKISAISPPRIDAHLRLVGLELGQIDGRPGAVRVRSPQEDLARRRSGPAARRCAGSTAR